MKKRKSLEFGEDLNNSNNRNIKGNSINTAFINYEQ